MTLGTSALAFVPSPAVAWGTFVLVLASALVLYLWPRSFSGPVTGKERSSSRARDLWSVIGRYSTPAAAVAGLWLLLPPAWPASFDYTSLTAGPTDRSGFVCVVESALARAKSRAGGANPARDDLRRAVIELSSEGFDVECPDEQQRDVAELADVESLEITLLMIHARAGRLGAVRISPGPLYSDVDAWSLAEPVLDEWADITILGSTQRFGPSIYRLDRAVGQGREITVWVVASPTAICFDDAPTATLSKDGEPLASCVLDRDSVREECETTTTSGTLAAQVRLICDHSVPDGAARLTWAQAPATSVRHGEQDAISVRDPHDLWRRARALAEIDTRRGGFLDDLGAYGFSLPSVEDEANVEVDLTRSDRIEIKGRGVDCPDDAAGTRSAFVDASGPFSFEGMDIDGSLPQVTVHERCVSIMVPPSTLGGPGEGDGSYDATTFYATMRAISWASRCVTTDCQTPASFEITETRAWPLLDRDEIDEAVGSARRLLDALGILLVATSLCLVALGYARSVH